MSTPNEISDELRNQEAPRTQAAPDGQSETPNDDAVLSGLLQRINQLTRPDTEATASHETVVEVEAEAEQAEQPDSTDVFVPPEPRSLREAGLNDSEVEELILKYLLVRGEDTGNGISEQTNLPFVLIDDLLRNMKQDQLVGYRGTTEVHDYIYQLTDKGRELGRRLAQSCTYYGSAPVTLEQYIESIQAQSIQHQHPSEEEVHEAFSDLLINKKMLMRLGPAINSGRGMFLFGFPGNGKTSIAERITRCFGKYIWIPRAIAVDGEIIRIFDPSQHEEAPLKSTEGVVQSVKFDHRWVRIHRPTIIVGGELTMDNLELRLNRATGVSEAPLQMKSNCGTLVIDDFGRQKMSTDELLNRWIVPLEKRFDYLNTSSGKKFQVPFDQLVVFSTNLEPRDLVDDAFLRRIPYKIEVIDPTEEEFRCLFKMMCPIIGIEHDQAAIDYVIETHYHAVNRPFRCCQPRDLLMQVKNYCLYRKEEAELTPQTLDFAVENYFAAV